MPPTDEITSREALEILDMSDVSAISRFVRDGLLVPSRKLPGRTGAFLFWRRDVQRLAADRAAARKAARGDLPTAS